MPGLVVGIIRAALINRRLSPVYRVSRNSSQLSHAQRGNARGLLVAPITSPDSNSLVIQQQANNSQIDTTKQLILKTKVNKLDGRTCPSLKLEDS